MTLAVLLVWIFRVIDSLLNEKHFMNVNGLLEADVAQFLVPWSNMYASGISCYKNNAPLWTITVPQNRTLHITYPST
jgi:hypothetical protein